LQCSAGHGRILEAKPKASEKAKPRAREMGCPWGSSEGSDTAQPLTGSDNLDYDIAHKDLPPTMDAGVTWQRPVAPCRSFAARLALVSRHVLCERARERPRPRRISLTRRCDRPFANTTKSPGSGSERSIPTDVGKTGWLFPPISQAMVHSKYGPLSAVQKIRRFIKSTVKKPWTVSLGTPEVSLSSHPIPSRRFASSLT
jgi:hypothetical protein